jgi:hypothetical protein
MKMEEIDIQGLPAAAFGSTVTRQLLRQRKKLLLWKRKAIQKTPKLGGALKER